MSEEDINFKIEIKKTCKDQFDQDHAIRMLICDDAFSSLDNIREECRSVVKYDKYCPDKHDLVDLALEAIDYARNLDENFDSKTGFNEKEVLKLADIISYRIKCHLDEFADNLRQDINETNLLNFWN